MQALFDWATCVRRGRQSDSGCRSWGSWQKWRKSDGTSAVLPCMHCYSVLRSAGTHITTRTFSPQLRCSEICRWYTSAILHLYLFHFFFLIFLTNHSVCFGKWFWPDVFNSSSCSSSRGGRTECEGWTKSVKGSRCYLHLARSWKRRLHICFVTE